MILVGGLFKSEAVERVSERTSFELVPLGPVGVLPRRCPLDRQLLKAWGGEVGDLQQLRGSQEVESTVYIWL